MPYIILVDAVGTTSFLAPEFHKRGFKCIHVASQGEKADYVKRSFRANDFEMHYAVTEDPNSVKNIIAELKAKNLDIRGVVPGIESGVILGDEIAYGLGIAHNDPQTSQARRYKDDMANCLQAAGLAHIPHIKSKKLDEIVNWANTNKC